MSLSTLRTLSAALIIPALGACTFWTGDLERIIDQSERDFHHDPSISYKAVPMEDLLAAPTSYKYIDVRFEVIVDRIGETAFVPMWTTFGSEDTISFSAWAPGADLWREADRVRSHPLFFMRKDNGSVPDLLSGGRYARVRISGRVMGDYEQKAWIQVNHVLVLERAVYTDAALAALSLGQEALDAKKADAALLHLESALEGIRETDLRIVIHLTCAELYEARGGLDEALAHYRSVLELDGLDPEAAEGVARITAVLEGRAVEAAAPQS